MDGVGIHSIMNQRAAVDVFGEWAESGRDEGMERGHSQSVEAMLELVLQKVEHSFTAIDIGCGNGWVVRRLQAMERCISASGIDGAAPMIAKAKSLDPDGEYSLGQLPDWSPQNAVDLIHSMECLYYLHEPMAFLQTMYSEWLNPGGWAVLGMDHYLENPSSHDWPESLNVHMSTQSIEEWKQGLAHAGFTKIQHFQVGEKEDWEGTLVLLAHKPFTQE